MNYYIGIKIHSSITFIRENTEEKAIHVPTFNEVWNSKEQIAWTNKKKATKRLNDRTSEYQQIFHQRKVIKYFINGDEELRIFLAELKLSETK
jgi:hypothetical protein